MIRLVRSYRAAADRGEIGGLKKKLYRTAHRFLSMLTGTDIQLGARIGDGLQLPHPNGVIIHYSAVIGSNCMIMQQVTIGMIGGTPPRIGDNAYIGAGAKVLGDITLGSDVRVGANAVVLVDVPDNHTAVGIPARVFKHTSRGL
ncbi:MAG: hypothetical protein JNN10_12700 [Sphingopyxis sp.]|nr:hypothetical protein [Sphingopyxis sp.]